MKRYKPLILWEYHNGFLHARESMIEDTEGEYVKYEEAEMELDTACRHLYAQMNNS